MDDLGGTIIFGNTHIYIYIQIAPLFRFASFCIGSTGLSCFLTSSTCFFSVRKVDATHQDGLVRTLGQLAVLNMTNGYQMSNEKQPGCLGYIGDYTTQIYGDYSKPL